MPRRDRDEPREKGRGDRERDDSRRERDRDIDGEDDPRRWRDDGKREDRLAARRERGRDKPTQDGNWESASDKRWPPGDDRETRYKRAAARDRKTGNAGDDLREKEERRGQDREKEKEPAWMDTYVPDSTAGILGGQNLTGELDGIQAWKKELKEKEAKEKDLPLSISSKDPEFKSSPTGVPEKPPMDEIQMFKMMMKQEEMKRNESSLENNLADATSNVQQRQHTIDHGKWLVFYAAYLAIDGNFRFHYGFPASECRPDPNLAGDQILVDVIIGCFDAERTSNTHTY